MNCFSCSNTPCSRDPREPYGDDGLETFEQTPNYVALDMKDQPTLEEIFENPHLRELFWEFLETSNMLEYRFFFEKLNEYKICQNEDERVLIGMDLFGTHLRQGSVHEITLNYDMIEPVALSLHSDQAPVGLFNGVENELKRILAGSTLYMFYTTAGTRTSVNTSTPPATSPSKARRT